MEVRTICRVEGIASDAALDLALAHRDIPIVMASVQLMGPLREALVRRVGFIREDQTYDWRRWLKAELIGHAALHVGDQREMPLRAIAHQERQAHEFAGTLIFGDPAATFGYPAHAVTTRMVARAARVPHECVEQWWRIVSSELGYTEPYRRARESAWWRTPAQRMAWGR